MIHCLSVKPLGYIHLRYPPKLFQHIHSKVPSLGSGQILKSKLIGVVSAWEDFREIARTMLAAAGVDPDLL
jgi:hypothetical protein